MIKNEIKNMIIDNLNNLFKEYEEKTRENLIEVSLNSLEKNLKELQNAIKEKDKDKILFSSHAMKGIFLNTRCFDLAEEFNDSNLKSLSLDETIKKIINSIQKVL